MECPICKESDGCFITLPCHQTHSFHRDCILEWVKKNPTCPTCRSAVQPADLEIAIDRLSRLLCKIKLFFEPFRYGIYNAFIYYRLALEYQKIGSLFLATDLGFYALLSLTKVPLHANLLISKAIAFGLLFQLDWLTKEELPLIILTWLMPIMANQVVLAGYKLNAEQQIYYDRLSKPELGVRASLGFLGTFLGCIGISKACSLLGF